MFFWLAHLFVPDCSGTMPSPMRCLASSCSGSGPPTARQHVSRTCSSGAGELLECPAPPRQHPPCRSRRSPSGWRRLRCPPPRPAPSSPGAPPPRSDWAPLARSRWAGRRPDPARRACRPGGRTGSCLGRLLDGQEPPDAARSARTRLEGHDGAALARQAWRGRHGVAARAQHYGAARLRRELVGARLLRQPALRCTRAAARHRHAALRRPHYRGALRQHRRQPCATTALHNRESRFFSGVTIGWKVSFNCKSRCTMLGFFDFWPIPPQTDFTAHIWSLVMRLMHGFAQLIRIL